MHVKYKIKEEVTSSCAAHIEQHATRIPKVKSHKFLSRHAARVPQCTECLGLRSIWESHAVVFVIGAFCPSRFEDVKSAIG
ncbi:hypothetical protein MTR_4g026580 [Medicago truncatula]|uniref:Uncharacterized protein n=1 Tax=Medicago truncatula TaxID=3880 RepID=G7JFY1_MEDTR|nr:hypothetical protein MTR_4g026580 [Medicago truncatula]